MDIEVNEYVRTKNKGIRKIDRIDNNKTINKYLYFTGKEDFEGKEYGIIKTTDIVKHSKQLIDLIEVGDIVKYKLKNLKHTNVTTVRLVQDARSNKEKKLIDGYNLEQIDILEILTKEQYNINCYKVGGKENE